MVIVLTGGIGSGKSEVSRILSERYSCSIYEADSKVKELYGRYTELVDDIESAIGQKVRNEAGYFEPSLLAKRIFSDKEALSKVEELVFPYLFRDFADFASETSGMIVFESATILDKACFRNFGDIVILVDAPVEIRLQRAVKRDSASKEKILERMDNQKIAIDNPRVDYVIVNDTTIEELQFKVDCIMEEILNKN